MAKIDPRTARAVVLAENKGQNGARPVAEPNRPKSRLWGGHERRFPYLVGRQKAKTTPAAKKTGASDAPRTRHACSPETNQRATHATSSAALRRPRVVGKIMKLCFGGEWG